MPYSYSKLRKVSVAVCLKSLLVLSALGISGCATTQMVSNKPDPEKICHANVTAQVVALEQVYYYNRFGSFNPAGMLYALRRDVVVSISDSKDSDVALNGKNLSEIPDSKLPALAGKVSLRSDKRPRPLVLRVNEGDCLEVTFTNLLSYIPPNSQKPYQETDPDLSKKPHRALNGTFFAEGEYPATRHASMHVNGLDYVPIKLADGTTQPGIASDGSNVGNNETSSLVAPGKTARYKWRAKKEGGFFFYSNGATAGGEGDGGQLGLGMFGAINVQPKGAKWYRSQITHSQLESATRGRNPNGTPVMRYADMSMVSPQWPAGELAKGARYEIIHSDLNAIIDITRKPYANGKAIDGKDGEDCGKPDDITTDKETPGASCGKPYREFTTIFHDEITAVQGIPELEDESSVFHGLKDGMAINYGAAGVGAILLANRKGVGPAKNCKECKLEEFFLASWANGDPDLVVRKDAAGNATEALYPDDPSNVHHSYLGDPVRFRNFHAGPKETHVFHLHAHQWVFDKHEPNSLYLDSQTVSPGAAFSYEVHYGGSGNRNYTVGDSIFHCHLYPHFAQGMWELWRVHDVFESGKPGLYDKVSNPQGRWLPDGEIAGGTPNVAIMPLPRTPLPPVPTDDFRGYPFFIAAQPGHRPPQAPLDLDAEYDASGKAVAFHDGGLPRHIILDDTEVEDGKKAVEEKWLTQPASLDCGLDNNKNFNEINDLYDKGKKVSACNAKRVWSLNSNQEFIAGARKLSSASIKELAFDGEPSEKIAMDFHSGKAGSWSAAMGGPEMASNKFGWEAKGYPTCDADGKCDKQDDRVLFRVNGRGPKPGSPYANPCPNEFLDDKLSRIYRAGYIQFSMTVNRSGWHDPQARVAVLEEDIKPTLDRTRPTEPLFFRANSGDCVVFKATNLIPSNLNLDDFQIFTPTDTIGQHIHLVKFDVTSSDGSGNGWNYEDGTLAADEVRERIVANNIKQATAGGKIFSPQTHRLFKSGNLAGDTRGVCPALPTNPRDAAAWKAWHKNALEEHPWCGAQTTVQRWWADPLLNKPVAGGGQDRTLRTVFSHDHFGPSSHQHHGLYAALVVEPTDSRWENLDGTLLGGSEIPSGANQARKPLKSSSSRNDGGPTSYGANILAPKAPDKLCTSTSTAEEQALNCDRERTRKEYNLAFADFAIVYTKENKPVNATNRIVGELPVPVMHAKSPSPESISYSDPGTQLINYRNEPIPLRVGEQDKLPNDIGEYEYHQKTSNPASCKKLQDMNLFSACKSGDIAACGSRNQALNDCKPTEQGDMANLFSSEKHAYQDSPSNPHQNGFKFANEVPGTRMPGDPATPILAGYEGEKIQLRLIQGAQEENHMFSAHGAKWLAQASAENSGYMNAQQLGISEHFEFEFKFGSKAAIRQQTDYLYASWATDNLWDGMWGLMRAFPLGKDPIVGLKPVPGTVAKIKRPSSEICDQADSANLPQRWFKVAAWHARDLFGSVAYNERFSIADPDAIIFIKETESEKNAKTNSHKKDTPEETAKLKQVYADLRKDVREGKYTPEPLILRAAANECITVNLTNCMDASTAACQFRATTSMNPAIAKDGPSNNYMPPITPGLNFNQLIKSQSVSLHPQLLATRTVSSDGSYVGYNDDTNVSPSQAEIEYVWYAGDYSFDQKESYTPIEFGVAALQDMADVVKHSSHGAVGAIVIEPEGSTWKADAGTNASATVTKKDGTSFRDFVLIYQDDLSLQQYGWPMANQTNEDDAEDSGHKGFNYRTEPLWGRLGFGPEAELEVTHAVDQANVFSSLAFNAGCKTADILPAGMNRDGQCGDPATPMFVAKSGDEVRFRVVHPAGHPRQHGFTLFGHDWPAAPWINNSKEMGYHPNGGNVVGSASGIGPGRHVNIMTHAGGAFKAPGDYLYRTQESFKLSGGLWGIFCVYDENDPKRCEPQERRKRQTEFWQKQSATKK
jgi:manganese oxidase